MIRIACTELESWYLGDMEAIEAVYPKFNADKFRNKAKFRNPDILGAADELHKLIPGFHKGIASKEIPKFMKLENNRSASFNHLVSGIQRFLIDAN